MAKTAMSKTAMTLDRLASFLAERGPLRPLARDLAMFDGFVTAIVAGPVSLEPPAWICPLLGVPRAAFNVGGTPEFAAICAAALHHNTVSGTLATRPDQFRPLHRTTSKGAVDPSAWCMGFFAAMTLSPDAWAPLLDPDHDHHGLLLPILLYCVDDAGRPMLGPPRPGPETEAFLREAHADIPAVVAALRQYWMPIRFGPRR
jgi:uncharacterized protein